MDLTEEECPAALLQARLQALDDAYKQCLLLSSFTVEPFVRRTVMAVNTCQTCLPGEGKLAIQASFQDITTSFLCTLQPRDLSIAAETASPREAKSITLLHKDGFET